MAARTFVFSIPPTQLVEERTLGARRRLRDYFWLWNDSMGLPMNRGHFDFLRKAKCDSLAIYLGGSPLLHVLSHVAIELSSIEQLGVERLSLRDKRNTITFYAVALTGDSTRMFPLLGKQSTEHNLGIKRLSPTGNGTGEPLD